MVSHIKEMYLVFDTYHYYYCSEVCIVGGEKMAVYPSYRTSPVRIKLPEHINIVVHENAKHAKQMCTKKYRSFLPQ